MKPRNFEDVVDQLLTVIPPGGAVLRAELESKKFNSRFVAPEIFQVVWGETATLLQEYLQERQEEPWVQDLLRIWRGETDKPAAAWPLNRLEREIAEVASALDLEQPAECARQLMRKLRASFPEQLYPAESARLGNQLTLEVLEPGGGANKTLELRRRGQVIAAAEKDLEGGWTVKNTDGLTQVSRTRWQVLELLFHTAVLAFTKDG